MMIHPVQINVKAASINAVSGVGDIALTCPEFVFTPGEEFECKIEVFSGSDIEVDIMVDNDMLQSIQVGCKFIPILGILSRN